MVEPLASPGRRVCRWRPLSSCMAIEYGDWEMDDLELYPHPWMDRMQRNGFPENYKVAMCPAKWGECQNWDCCDFHSPGEQRCKFGANCTDPNCRLIHVDVKEIRKTLCIDVKGLGPIFAFGPDPQQGKYFSRAILWNFQGISLPAIAASLKHCPFLTLLVCPDLEIEVGKHYIKENAGCFPKCKRVRDIE